MKQFIELISNILNVPSTELSLQSGPEDIVQWDSLAHINIITALEQTYDLQITMSEILTVKTVADLVNLVENKGIPLN